MKKKITVILMVILIGIMAAGCGQQQKTEQTAGTEESASQDIFAMDTYMSVTAYGADAESAVSDAIAEIERLDALLSTGETDSEIYKLNQNGGGSISGRILLIFLSVHLRSGKVRMAVLRSVFTH